MRAWIGALAVVVCGCARGEQLDDVAGGPSAGSQGGVTAGGSGAGSDGGGGSASTGGTDARAGGATSAGGTANVGDGSGGAGGHESSSGGAADAGDASAGGMTANGGTTASAGGSTANGGTATAGGAASTGGASACTTVPGVPGSTRTPTRKIKDLTGTGTSSGAFGVGGTALGIPVRQPNGKIAYVFGDTFDDDRAHGTGWRAPVLLRSEPGFDADGIDFDGAAGGTRAKQILDYAHDNQTSWLPSDAITIGSRMYLHYIVNQGLGNVQWTQIAYSDDGGETWTSSDARWEANENDGLRQLWTWERGCDGYVYVLSTKFITRDRPIILHRVPEEKILDKSAYEPWGWDGSTWAWGHPASVVLDGAFGELSLRRIEDKWVLSWFNAGAYEITIKVFDSPTSNLYDAHTYHPLLGTDWCSENDTHVAQLYGGYIHPDSTLHELHLIVSQWSTSAGPCHPNPDSPYHAMEFVTGVE
ncbi:MAG TPA: DUF4185 domain-containing protein [Polyangiaceae bacterium]|nr:DUF4185 domain-containing protein [Polyangiaceae bacterium]